MRKTQHESDLWTESSVQLRTPPIEPKFFGTIRLFGALLSNLVPIVVFLVIIFYVQGCW